MSPPIYIRDKSPYCPRDSKEDRADKHELQYSAENQSENQAKDQPEIAPTTEPRISEDDKSSPPRGAAPAGTEEKSTSALLSPL